MTVPGPSHPLLILPPPRRTDRARRGPGFVRVHRPDLRRQSERIGPRLQALQQSFDARRAELSAELVGAEPERVVVLETVGTIANFLNAVRRIDGLEFLGDLEERDIPPDEDFYDEQNPTAGLTGTLYLLMTNDQAMQQLLSLWRRVKDDPDVRLEHGLAKFKELFRLLHDVRPWGPEDRIRDTGILAAWREQISLGYQEVPTEVELWFRDDHAARRTAEAEVRRYVQDAGGQVLTSAQVEEIGYHAVLARLPITTVEPLLQDVSAAALVRSDRVMFLRPAGHSIPTPDAGDTLAGTSLEPPRDDLRSPVVAMLDGVPLEQHQALAGRLSVDDPDGYAANAPAGRRRHGTAMASQILHGDLNAPGPPLASSLYVRPVLKPDTEWGMPREAFPADVLVVDLIHRAVRRIFERDGTHHPSAPSVRVISLSLGDDGAPFVRMLSPWARLLDWISWHYGVLVVVSAGNHPGELTLRVSPSDLPTMTGQQLEQLALQALSNAGHDRRILSPGESLNALTVGASNHDGSVPPTNGQQRELLMSPGILAPYSALGLGYRRSIKPDVLLPGGRRLYERSIASNDAETVWHGLHQPTSPPGQLVAAPSPIPGVLDRRVYQQGTSNAAALASRAAGQLHDLLVDLQHEAGADFLADQAVLVAAIKALLVHGAECHDAKAAIRSAFDGRVSGHKLSEFTSRFIGYGEVDLDRAFGSTAQRATMLGGGRLPAESADSFHVPLPPSLSARAGLRRLTATLAWLTPVNHRDYRYRQARLWFDPPARELNVSRCGADRHAAQRGTVQHEILEGDRASVFADGDALTIQVNCAAEAGNVRDEVPYALAVSLEAAPDLDVPVFAEISQRIRPLVVVRP